MSLNLGKLASWNSTIVEFQVGPSVTISVDCDKEEEGSECRWRRSMRGPTPVSKQRKLSVSCGGWN